ncbi:MAG: response regulator [Acidobacteriota bacterium]
MATILVVDSEESLRSVVSMIFSDKHIVLEANDIQEALTIFNQHKLDLIIIDVNTTGIRNIELIRRGQELTGEVKIIAYSASISSWDKYLAILEAGADLCLPKAGNIDILEIAVSKLLCLEADLDKVVEEVTALAKEKTIMAALIAGEDNICRYNYI